MDFFAGLQKDEVIYVGDAPSDITASHKVGIAVVAAALAEAPEPEKLKELQPDELFHTTPAFADWQYSKI